MILLLVLPPQAAGAIASPRPEASAYGNVALPPLPSRGRDAALPPKSFVLADAAGLGAEFVQRRLNSPERKADVDEAANKDAEARATRGSAANGAKAGRGASSAFSPEDATPAAGLTGRTNAVAAVPPTSPHNVEHDASSLLKALVPFLPAGSSNGSAPRPLSYSLMDLGASILGVPAPTFPNRDEGAGFHQDGTVRKAGGAENDGPSDGGRRAAAYAQHGLGNSYLGGYIPLSAIGYDPLTGRYDPSRDGRSSDTRQVDIFSSSQAAQDRVLSWGMGALNSAGEAAVSSFIRGARARLNYTLDDNGKLRGDGDVLLPLYDGRYTTIFAQAGLRSMDVSGGNADGQDRWIGNFGLGERWFPAAKDEMDAGDWMIGYNAFYDIDFTRAHRRGGVGVEAQFDWLRLSSNSYFPLSGWKGSYDFDRRFVEERPAAGWDTRLKAYLPFYRNMALTGSFTQWFGEHVGMFGPSRLEKNPKVWSYGLEYTPIPLVSGFLTQRTTQRGETETEYGLHFTYRFDMPWDEQTRHSKVAEMRSVSGSRHEFVDRENRIILEYRAKQDYQIEYLGGDGDNGFRFRVLKTFGGYAAGQAVTVNTGGNWLTQHNPRPPDGFVSRFVAALGAFVDEIVSVRSASAGVSSKSYVTDGQGEFLLRLDSIDLPPDGLITVTVSIGNSSASFELRGKSDPYKLEMNPATLVENTQTAVTFTVLRGGTPAAAGTSVTFTANDRFTGLPSSEQKTGSDGTIPVSGLTALASGAQTIHATVEGQAVSVSFTVAAGTYTLEPNTLTMTQGVPADPTFTLKMNGTVVPDKIVSFTANPNFKNLPATATTGTGGTFTITGLTAKAAGSQTIQVAVDSEKLNIAVTVTAGTYTLEMAPPSLVENIPTNVTFTVKQGGAAVGSGINVTFPSGSGDNAKFGNLPAGSTATSAAGTFTITGLTAKTAGTQTIQATVSGQAVTVEVTVTAGTYTLEMTPSTLTQGIPERVTFALKIGSVPTAGKSVSFTANDNFIGLPETATTNVDGQFAISSLTAKTAGTQTIQATVDTQPVTVSVAVTAGTYTLTMNPSALTQGIPERVTFALKIGS
ncbi:MAG: inverse autotransporter beta domain-containing protein, partial [Desulfovibrio sp.]|nr:inverse autotransporter beta domain-containing protein [Desulfovibrio sp.]